tara:strand:- start:187 stop:531 length:345 start_codon:yes stop_codon:yes gene_type:complete
MQTQEKINNFVKLVEKRYVEYMDNSFPSLTKNHVKLFKGRKYSKILLGEYKDDKNGSVHSFINNENGDIYKPNSWIAPHKTPRGNINSEYNGEEAFGSNKPISNSYYWIKYLNR